MFPIPRSHERAYQDLRFGMRGNEVGDCFLDALLVAVVEQHVPVTGEAAVPIGNIGGAALVRVIPVDE